MGALGRRFAAPWQWSGAPLREPERFRKFCIPEVGSRHDFRKHEECRVGGVPEHFRKQGSRGRLPPMDLPGPFSEAMADYSKQLRMAPLAPASRAKYLSRVRGFLAWLADSEALGDALNE